MLVHHRQHVETCPSTHEMLQRPQRSKRLANLLGVYMHRVSVWWLLFPGRWYFFSDWASRCGRQCVVGSRIWALSYWVTGILTLSYGSMSMTGDAKFFLDSRPDRPVGQGWSAGLFVRVLRTALRQDAPHFCSLVSECVVSPPLSHTSHLSSTLCGPYEKHAQLSQGFSRARQDLWCACAFPSSHSRLK